MIGKKRPSAADIWKITTSNSLDIKEIQQLGVSSTTVWGMLFQSVARIELAGVAD